jgi:hypothetical protein
LPPLSPHDDMVGPPFSEELDGCVLDYRYATGHRYRLEFFAGEKVSFEMIDSGDGEPLPLPPDDAQGNPIDLAAPRPCRVRKLRDELFLVHWLVRPGPGIHVALIVDLDRKQVHSAAMMPPNQWEYFDVAEVTEVTRR